MKITDIEKYEIMAEAFHIITGHIAPGKDPSPESQSAPFDERWDLWTKWLIDNSKILTAIITAVSRIMPDDDNN